MVKVYPRNLNGEIHEDYQGVDNNKDYQKVRLTKEREGVIKNINIELKHLRRIDKLLREMSK